MRRDRLEADAATSQRVNPSIYFLPISWYPSTLPKTLKILSWNCRGAGRNGLKWHIHKHSPDVVFLMKTRLESDLSSSLSMYRDSFTFCGEPNIGRSGGWIFGFNKPTVSFSLSGSKSSANSLPALDSQSTSQNPS